MKAGTVPLKNPSGPDFSTSAAQPINPYVYTVIRVLKNNIQKVQSVMEWSFNLGMLGLIDEKFEVNYCIRYFNSSNKCTCTYFE